VDSEDERKDMHQEILCQTWKSFANFRGESAFSTWLYRICLNTALTYRKKEDHRKKAKLVAKMPNQEVANNPSSDHEMLYLIIKQLKEVDRMLITLHLDGYKNPEIAEITGLKVNHVNVKIHRIKSSIIDQLKKAEI